MEISIKKPCHENWDAMTPNEAGAFCCKCVKTVVDFSEKSLDEIKNFFESKQDSKTCGRFTQQQLVSLSFDSFFEEFKRFTLTKRLAVILYFTFGMWLFGTPQLMAQEKVKGDIDVKHNSIMGGVRAIRTPNDTLKTCEKPKQNPKAVKGKVAVKQKPVEQIKMGEVSVESPKKKRVSSK